MCYWYVGWETFQYLISSFKELGKWEDIVDPCSGHGYTTFAHVIMIREVAVLMHDDTPADREDALPT